MSQKWDMAGNDLVVNGVYVGASTPGSAGTLLSGSEITVLDSVTPGTVAASKAVVVDSNKDIATFRHFTLSGNFVTGSTTLSEADLAQVDGITAGTVSASKALVPTSGKELTWTTTSSGTGTVTPLSLTMTNTGIGASMDGAYFITATEAALGTYANAVNGKLNFGTAGRVSGLGAPICAELDLGPGTTPGSYACYEAELNAPASASTGARTSFFSLNLWGGNKAAVDTAGYLFDLGGVTANSAKLFNSGLTQVVTASARLRVQVNGTNYYIPLCASEALTS